MRSILQGGALVWGCVSLFSCATAEPAAPEPCTPGQPGCPEAVEEAPAGEQMTTDERMWHHFWLVAEARNAVVAGDLEAVRPPMEKLASGQYGEEIPYDWMEWVREMQAQAKLAAAAKDLPGAAKAVSSVAASCAECHRATRGGKAMGGDTEEYKPRGATGLKEAMARHVWAADELWIGMTSPHHPSWVRGWKALTESQMVPDAEEGAGEAAAAPAEGEAAAGGEGAAAPAPGAVPASMQAEIDAIRALGEKAKTADLPKQKVEIYADLITRCGNCHSALSVKIN